MDEGLIPLLEVSERAWQSFKDSLKDIGPDEIDWRPLPQANSINTIVRHLRIEAEWHADCIENGVLMPAEMTPEVQRLIDAVPMDFGRNVAELEQLFSRFHVALRQTSLESLRRQTDRAYNHPAWTQAEGTSAGRRHFLGYHQPMHLAGHTSQIRTIRNLFRTTRGESGRFFPENPTFPTATE